VADISLRAVSKRFGAVEAVRELSLEIAHGEFVVLLGPTGAGKTTTLRLIAGLEQPDRGDVFIHGRNVTRTMPAERDVAFVFQQYSLYPHLTVYDNLAFPLRSPARRLDEKAIRRRVGQVATLLHIDHKLGNRSTALSGGEMQRVAIGRALVREPSAYLMDEPLSSLDAKLRAELRLELKRLQVEFGTTILYVTHDQIEAMTMADRIGVIDEGRLLQLDTPRAIYERPASIYVASRLGTPPINLIPAGLWHPAGMPPQAHMLGVRTEHIRISTTDRAGTSAGQVAEVHRIEHLGDQNHVHLDFAGHSLVTLADPDRPLKAGDQVSLELADPLFFDSAGLRIEAGVSRLQGGSA
jgi:multiple sugar transport system ATP-binding protein